MMLSVIIPVFNVSEYLTRCVDSILSQSYTDWEMILVDDGSVDNSGSLCDQFAATDSRIKTFHQNNQGASAARNKGLDEAKGSHIIFVDADDWIDPNMFSIMMEDNRYDVVVCGFNRVTMAEDGSNTVEVIDLWPENSHNRVITKNVYYEVLCRTGTLWNKIFRSECIDRHRFDTNLSYGEDTVFLAKVLREVELIRLIKQPLYNYYINRPGNVVSAHIDARSLDYLNSARIIYDEARIHGEAQSGVYKVHMTAWNVMEKIPDLLDKQYHPYVSECISIIRYPSFNNKLEYAFGNKIVLANRRARVFYLLYSLFPRIMLRIRQYSKRTRAK